MIDVGRLLQAMEHEGYRVTAPRREIVELLAEQDGPFAAADLLTRTQDRGHGVGRATIFRTLDLLVELGMVERIDLPSGEHAYLACQPTHHHHVVCSRCGRSLDIDDAGLRKVVASIARRTGYRIDDHRLELFGLCPDCQVA